MLYSQETRKDVINHVSPKWCLFLPGNFGMDSVSLFVFFVLSHLLLLLSAEVMRYTQRCPQFFCENLGYRGFPFTNNTNPECGVFILECGSLYSTIQLQDGGRPYEVKYIYANNTQYWTIGVRDTQLSNDLTSSRCETLTNLTFPSSSFIHFEIATPNQTLFKCKRDYTIRIPQNFESLHCNLDYYDIYYSNSSDSFPTSLSGCSIIQLPKNMSHGPLLGEDSYQPFSLLTAEFDLVVRVSDECYSCYKIGGQCKAGDNGKLQCAGVDKGSQRFAMILVLGTLPIGIGVVIAVICCLRREFSSNRFIYFWKKESLTDQTIQAFLGNHGPLAVRRYRYLDIKKMTNLFRDKLGEGGYGGVYKGKLQDGCLVAVKVLKESRGNGEEFINEVASISRTSHVNIVSLIGFCFEGSKRALIYEFMPNGSLEKYIYKKSPSKAERQLEWETLYKIALGIAQGLEYLHKGCNTRIVHFDIKPHNILLDENFCPKISDFGLAKICHREVSIISMLGARGTAGYIAPEVFCRNFGGVSHKSDVYSYGMMTFEMVGGRRNIDVEIDRTSEIFFPHWIYKRLEQDEDLGLHGLVNEEDHKHARKMIIVSLWCIQTNPSSRPPMSRVVSMLEGSLESLQIPPMPFLYSPSRSPEDSSTTMRSELE